MENKREFIKVLVVISACAPHAEIMPVEFFRKHAELEAVYPTEDNNLVCLMYPNQTDYIPNRAIFGENKEVINIINGTFFVVNYIDKSDCYADLTPQQLTRAIHLFTHTLSVRSMGYGGIVPNFCVRNWNTEHIYFEEVPNGLFIFKPIIGKEKIFLETSFVSWNKIGICKDLFGEISLENFAKLVKPTGVISAIEAPNKLVMATPTGIVHFCDRNAMRHYHY